MRPTIEYVKQKFDEFNRQMFGGRLPEIPIVLNDSKALGLCCYTKRPGPDGLPVYTDFRLKVSTRADLPEEEVEDTIIHEMIHYFILVNRLHDSGSHGPLFKAIMQSINANYGRHIGVTYKPSPEEAGQFADTKRKWHVIAVVRLTNSRTGVKVLPRIQPHIVEWNKKIAHAPGVDSVEYYLHDDPFFNQFPNSKSFRLATVDHDTVMSHLTSARRLTVTDRQVY